MLQKGCKKSSITAAIGPCIQQNSYNVGYEFEQRFIKKIDLIKFFLKGKRIKFFSIYQIL